MNTIARSLVQARPVSGATPVQWKVTEDWGVHRALKHHPEITC